MTSGLYKQIQSSGEKKKKTHRIGKPGHNILVKN